ncbi:MAG: hypothetical protein OXR66_03410 [Candidatus Woesearchaeota archaeon]|nr:hypothetical protein [Candidatus Woesearchaeota archaeon]
MPYFAVRLQAPRPPPDLPRLAEVVREEYHKKRAAGITWGINTEEIKKLCKRTFSEIRASHRELAFEYRANTRRDDTPDIKRALTCAQYIFADAHRYDPRYKTYAPVCSEARAMLRNHLERMDKLAQQLIQTHVPEKTGQRVKLADVAFSLSNAQLPQTYKPQDSWDYQNGYLDMGGLVLLFADGSVHPILTRVKEEYRKRLTGYHEDDIRVETRVRNDNGLPSTSHHETRFRPGYMLGPKNFQIFRNAEVLYTEQEGPIRPHAVALYDELVRDLARHIHWITADSYHEQSTTFRSDESSAFPGGPLYEFPSFNSAACRAFNRQKVRDFGFLVPEYLVPVIE